MALKTEREVAVLGALAPALPLPVPVVRYVGRPCARFPYPFTGQRRIRGVMGEVLRPPRERWPGLARQRGAFLAALHRCPAARALDLDLDLGLAPRPLEPPQRLVAEDGRLFERAVAYRRYECLRALGVRLLGRSADPLDLLLTQLRWACTAA